MLEHHGDAGDRTGDALPIDPDFALVRRDQAVDAAQQRGLAAAGRADDGDDLALADLEIDTAEDFKRPVALGQALHTDAGTCTRRLQHWACPI